MKVKIVILLVACMVAALPVLAACIPETVEEPITDTPATSPEPVLPSPEHSPPAMQGENLLANELLVRGNSNFAFDLYRKLKEEDGNLLWGEEGIRLHP